MAMDQRIRMGQAAGYQAVKAPRAAGQGAPLPGGFRIPERASAITPAALPGIEMAGLVAAIASPRDHLARRRGRALLRGLDDLQRGLLAGADNPDVMSGLAGLLEGEDGDDPALADTLRALALRARIELARRGIQREDESGDE
jgi:hypothetical protein